MGPGGGGGDYPTGGAPLKRFSAPLTRMNKESEDIEVNSHIRRKVRALSDQSDCLGPGGCSFDDTNDGVVKARRFELETKGLINGFGENKREITREEKIPKDCVKQTGGTHNHGKAAFKFWKYFVVAAVGRSIINYVLLKFLSHPILYLWVGCKKVNSKF